MTETLVAPISTLVGFDSGDVFRNPQHEKEMLFSQFLEDCDRNEVQTGFIPALDLSEVDDILQAEIDIPGMKPGEIAIQVSDDLLVISGEREEESENKGKTYFWNERRIGMFSRSVNLPCRVVIDKVTAAYSDGVLTICLPKVAEAKAKRVNVIVR